MLRTFSIRLVISSSWEFGFWIGVALLPACWPGLPQGFPLPPLLWSLLLLIVFVTNVSTVCNTFWKTSTGSAINAAAGEGGGRAARAKPPPSPHPTGLRGEGADAGAAAPDGTEALGLAALALGFLTGSTVKRRTLGGAGFKDLEIATAIWSSSSDVMFTLSPSSSS